MGAPVGVAFPVQRHSPKWVMLACAAEIGALGLFALTASFPALGVLVLAALVLTALAATNRRLVLAVAADGLMVLAATRRGRPVAPIGPAPKSTLLPEPAGFGVSVDLDGRIWWIDRSSFARLRRARELDRRSGG